jgi:hypothetical protein
VLCGFQASCAASTLVEARYSSSNHARTSGCGPTGQQPPPTVSFTSAAYRARGFALNAIQLLTCSRHAVRSQQGHVLPAIM